MDANPQEKTPKRRWRDAVAFVAAVAVSLPIIMGVPRSLPNTLAWRLGR